MTRPQTGARRGARNAVAPLVMAVLALGVLAVILLNQPQFRTPGFIDGGRERPFTFRAEFTSAPAVVAGQGQTVDIAGVPVGNVRAVGVRAGRAVVTLEVRRRYLPIYRDASILLRPRTPLKDMYLALDPGTPAAGRLAPGQTLPVSQTRPTVDYDEVLSHLDADTRAYLQIILASTGQALRRPAAATGDDGAPSDAAVADLRGTYDQIGPLAHRGRLVTEALAARRASLRRAVGALARISTEFGSVDRELAALVDGADGTFAATAAEDGALRAALDRLPGTLRRTRAALAGVGSLSVPLRGALVRLEPFARALPTALRSARTLAQATTPVLRDRLRPFATDVRPSLAVLTRSGRRLRTTVRPLGTTLGVLNRVTDALAHDPPGRDESFLFWGAWLTHNTASVFAGEDALGTVPRAVVLATCPQLVALHQVELGNPTLSPILKLLNPADRVRFCGDTALPGLAPRRVRDPRVAAVNPAGLNRRGLTMIVAFLMLCALLTTYLWLTFGGATPLQPDGYRLRVQLPDAGGITNQADVRIAGVDVGKVTGQRYDRARNLTILDLEIAPRYAPRPRGTRAMVRLKTVLGETYLQLSPGTAGAPPLDENATIPARRVTAAVHFDDILRTFDPRTRAALATWLAGQGEVLRGGGPALNDALAGLAPLGRYGDETLSLLDRQGGAFGTLLRDGGRSLGALTRRRGELRTLVARTGEVFSTTGARDASLRATLRALPGALRGTRATIRRAAGFSATALPLVRQLRPAARQLGPVLGATDALAPDLRRMLATLGPLTSASRAGVPALGRTLDDLRPLLGRLRPYLGTLTPAFGDLARRRRDVVGAIANLAAATQATLPAADGSGPLHYARVSFPINPESLAIYPERLRSTRSNAYPGEDDADQLRGGLPVLDARSCGSGPLPSVDPGIVAELRRIIVDSYFTDHPDGPPCRQQPGGRVRPVLTPLP